MVASSLSLLHPASDTSARITGTSIAHNYGLSIPIASYTPFYAKYDVQHYELSNQSVPARLDIVLGFQMSNYSALQALLSNLNSPSSPQYHRYLTKSQFDSEFGGSHKAYADMVSYLKSRGVANITEYADRLTISFSASPVQIKSVFNVTISEFTSLHGEFYAATSTPELPRQIANNVTSIEGLSDYSKYTISLAPLTLNTDLGSYRLQNLSQVVNSYPQPLNRSGAQYLYGSNMQVAYQVDQLYKQYGYPTNMVEATILWSGSYTGPGVNTKYGVLKTGTPVGPFYPSDIYAYFNQTLPKGEPHSTVYGVPIDGAQPPGFLASYDSTSANVENTLDLEMLGSLAPGSTIYNFYSGSPSTAGIDQSFATILNPASDSSLNASEMNSVLNVSVISNSWGGNDSLDPAWSNYMAEAQARGITVLAASGDSGDSPQSSVAAGTLASFPASAAYDTYGTVAVGGVTVRLSSNLTIASQISWYDQNTSLLSSTYGTQSGISSVYAEPVWQRDSLANQLIQGQGRGIPDISALANNTIMTVTIDGSTYNSTDLPYGVSFAAVMGTSISSPLVGGIIAEVNHVLNATDQGNLGFLDPVLYSLGDLQYSEPAGNSTFSVSYGAGYNSSIPVRPFYPITQGHNYVYFARYGYSLLNGWGTLNAYNFTSCVLNSSTTGTAGFLSGAYYNLSMTSINASVQAPGGSTVQGSNFTVTLSAVIADSTGQPTYLVAESVSFNKSGPSNFSDSFSVSLTSPFELPVSERVVRNGTFAGGNITLPGYLNLSMVVNETTTPLGRTIVVGGGNSSITLPAPLGAYLVGRLNYSYYYNGYVYYNGPNPNNNITGGLDPQLTIGSGNGIYTAVASGSILAGITAGIMNIGSTTWTIPGTTAVVSGNLLNPTKSENFGYVKLTNNSWNVVYSSGSTTLGIASFVNGNYLVTFQETGLPSGTYWHVYINGLVPSYPLGNESYGVVLTNGTYSYTATSVNKTYAISGANFFTVNGENLSITVHFSILRFNVTFVETGLGKNVTWSLSLSGLNSTGPLTQSTYSYQLPNGTYHYTVARSSNIYTTLNFSGEFTVSGSSLTIPLTFYILSYTVVIRETGLQDGQSWNITFAGVRYTITGTSMILEFSNGTYSYSVESIPGYTISNQNGVVQVNGTIQSLIVEFKHPPNYDMGLLIDLGIGTAIVLAVGYVIYRFRKK